MVFGLQGQNHIVPWSGSSTERRRNLPAFLAYFWSRICEELSGMIYWWACNICWIRAVGKLIYEWIDLPHPQMKVFIVISWIKKLNVSFFSGTMSASRILKVFFYIFLFFVFFWVVVVWLSIILALNRFSMRVIACDESLWSIYWHTSKLWGTNSSKSLKVCWHFPQ